MWRVRERRTFEAFRRHGRSGSDGPITVVHLPAEHDPLATVVPDGPPRVAYAAGRSVGSAVERNRLRRQLRVAVAQEAAEHGLEPGAYLVVVRPGAKGLSLDELRGHVRRALRRCEARGRR
ncbi:MAG: ribonuclease P protein component [Acidimicrobiia bacterium]|nr:ribonuclease P protein component [Acidimicrobiia bacterium]